MANPAQTSALRAADRLQELANSALAVSKGVLGEAGRGHLGRLKEGVLYCEGCAKRLHGALLAMIDVFRSRSGSLQYAGLQEEAAWERLYQGAGLSEVGTAGREGDVVAPSNEAGADLPGGDDDADVLPSDLLWACRNAMVTKVRPADAPTKMAGVYLAWARKSDAALDFLMQRVAKPALERSEAKTEGEARDVELVGLIDELLVGAEREECKTCPARAAAVAGGWSE